MYLPILSHSHSSRSFCFSFQETGVAGFSVDLSIGFWPVSIRLTVEAGAANSCDGKTGRDNQLAPIRLADEALWLFWFSARNICFHRPVGSSDLVSGAVLRKASILVTDLGLTSFLGPAMFGS